MMRLALRQREAAEALGMGLDKFRELVNRGVLPEPVNIGDMRRWRVRDLEEALDRLKVSSHADPLLEAAAGRGRGSKAVAHD